MFYVSLSQMLFCRMACVRKTQKRETNSTAASRDWLVDISRKMVKLIVILTGHQSLGSSLHHARSRTRTPPGRETNGAGVVFRTN